MVVQGGKDRGLSNYSGDRDGESAAAVSEAAGIGLKIGPLWSSEKPCLRYLFPLSD